MADLKLVGADAYAQHPTTEILCFNYSIDDGPCHRWYNHGPVDDHLYHHADDPDVLFVAHNAGFEQAIWREIMVKQFGFPPLPPERWDDTMAMCAHRGYPLQLEKAGIFARLALAKDMEGSRLTVGLSRVNKKTGMLPVVTPEILRRVAGYCDRDVEVESGLRRRIGLLSKDAPHERGIWLLDQKINQRGLRIDMEFVRAAEEVVRKATIPLRAEFQALTGGLNPGQVEKVVAWAGTQGVPLDNLQKGYLEELLDGPAADDDAGYVSNAGDDDAEVPLGRVGPLRENVRRVLEIRRMLGSASIKKLARMRSCVCSDGRVRGTLQYHAAGPGRWGGRLFQPQNFPRGTVKHAPEVAVDAILTGDPSYVESALGAPAIECVSSSLRHALVAAPGHTFLVGDFAGIEARLVLALAGQHDKTALIANGANPYLDFGQMMFGHPIDKANLEEYIPSKSGVLGCGFQCGPPNFALKFLDGDVLLAEKVVHAYRKQWAPKVPHLWYALEAAALRAVETGVSAEAYGVVYKPEGAWLSATLPSGWQKLWYPEPTWHAEGKFGKPHWMSRTYKGGRMTHRSMYGGLLTENAVQGLARGLLVASMMRLEREGFPIVLTVHDEIMCEVPEDRAGLPRFKALMAEPTAWSERLRVPVAVEEWQGSRYKK
ncbi:MAG: hypothetical protein ACREDH_15630 [Methylocella sp.]